jgi:hypothetical protein
MIRLSEGAGMLQRIQLVGGPIDIVKFSHH